MDKLHLEIVTPEKLIYSDDVDMVVVPGSEGDLGILPHHIALFTKIKPGEIKIKKGEIEDYLAATGGFLDVAGDGRVTILADYAVKSDEIEIEKVAEAKKKAEEAMKEKRSETDFALAESELRKSILELKIAERRKSPKNQTRM